MRMCRANSGNMHRLVLLEMLLHIGTGEHKAFGKW